MFQVYLEKLQQMVQALLVSGHLRDKAISEENAKQHADHMEFEAKRYAEDSARTTAADAIQERIAVALERIADMMGDDRDKKVQA